MSRDKQIEEMVRAVCIQMRDYPKLTCRKCKDENRSTNAYCRIQFEMERLYNAGYRKASDVAEEIFAEIEKRLVMYSHLHRYAEEAKQVTDEYADGTPCEMTSVWDAISLQNNGWADYETMNKLQDNIGNIEKSRLLKEFEGDIAELKKKYESEKDNGN